ncbi:MAG: alanine racemase, partial [Candidatus Eisenbacteria bacterium]|nr:alanine racemase [Candidatus Eisenbacteria bacterium]
MDFPTWVEIDLDRLDRNLRSLVLLAGQDVSILFVVKADGYGLGAVEVGRSAIASGASFLGVATLHEGIELRQAGIETPIVILSPNFEGEFPEVLAWRLRPTLSTLEQAAHLACAARGGGEAWPAHVEVDTGMGRTGFDFAEAHESIRRIAGMPEILIDGIFTHFPDSDGPDRSFTSTQVDRFGQLLASLEQEGIRPRWRHAANTAGLLAFPESRFNMVRPGLGVLGLVPSAHVPMACPIEPVVSLHARLAQIRSVPAGQNISYGTTFVTRRPSRIGVTTIGYGHGLPRRLSNRGEMVVSGHRVPIVGRVTMDLTMVDLTDHPGAMVGEEVVVFGAPAAAGSAVESITLEEVAAWAETITWEILCQID